ncbi:MAG: recombinase family protein [Selenomonas sp.]|nr:recombinase family protein [Selenomonas sp.]
MKAKIYGYVRVSTKEQHIDRQLLAMRAQGVARENIFVDRQSGKDFARPAYQQMLKALTQGSILVIKSVDRLGRNYEEIIEQWRYIIRVKRAGIKVIDMPMLDTDASRDLMGTVISDVILGLQSAFAQAERELNLQRQAEGIAAAKLRGVQFGRTPKERTATFYALRELWQKQAISARRAAQQLSIDHKTFLRWARDEK